MGEIFLAPVDFSAHEALNMLLHMVAGNHGNPQESMIWWDSSAKRVKIHNGSAVKSIAFTDDGGGSGGDAETLDGQEGTYYLSRANHSGTQALTTITGHDKAAHDALDIDASTLDSYTPANLRDRSTHTGTQAASTISDLATVVKAYRLDEFADPNASVDLNSQKIVNLANGTADGDAVNKGQLNTAVSGPASTGYVDSAVAALVDSAPGTLNTLNELAEALGDDANFSTTVTNAIAARAKKFYASYGDGTATSIDVVHNFGTRDVSVEVYDNASPYSKVRPGIRHKDANTVTLIHSPTAPTTNQYRVVILGG